MSNQEQPTTVARPRIRLFTLCLALVAALMLFCVQPAPASQAAETPAADLGNAQDLTAFMDGLINAQLQAYHVPGAEVAVVKDGQVILLKGYGYADREQLTPVDASKTLFRPGSVSKLFTWTAVMQLVEQGKIDLNADINTYLDFKLPATFGKPITMLDLMDHTPGFEDVSRYVFVAKAEELRPLGAYLKSEQPQQIYPPGTISAYSNYGATLAGYIVERVSGEPFDQYVERHILQPLGMDHSTFRQPLPAGLAPDMALGYLYQGGVYQPRAFELVQMSPAGALTAPAADMAKFMLAHLDDGQYNGQRILQTATVQQMHQQSFTADPSIPGWAHGFMEEESNGQHLLVHGGDTIVFHSLLAIIPDKHVGFYVTYNSQGGAYARTTAFRAFMDRYFPVERSVLTPPADFAARAAEYTGFYGLSRKHVSGPLSLLGALQALSVSSGPDHTLLIPGLVDPGAQPYVEVGPLMFENQATGDRILFGKDASGHVKYLYPTAIQGHVGIKLPWYETPPFNIGLLASCLVLFLTGIFSAPVGLFGLRAKPPADLH